MAAGDDEQVRDALSLVQEASLPHPMGPLLCAFVEEALNRRMAATYIKRHCERGEDLKVQAALLASGWQYVVECVSQYGSRPPHPDAQEAIEIRMRDGQRCCITGRAGTPKDPLILAPILPVPTGWSNGEPRILDMLGAFFSPPYRDWWLAYIRDPTSFRVSGYHSHWLVRKSAADAFANGTIRLQRLHPSVIRYKIEHLAIGTLDECLDVDGLFPLLGDHSRSAIPHVDPRFVGTQARLAPSIRWLAVASKIAQSPTSTSVRTNGQLLGLARAWSPFRFLRNPCLFAWRLLPARLRVAAYQVLRRIGRRLYGNDGPFSTVQRLPFGLYLKYQVDPGEVQNEFNTLDMIRRNTSIPVPTPLDVAVVPSSSSKPLFPYDGYLLTTRLPGTPLVRCEELLSDLDLGDYIAQMQGFLTELRRIPKTVGPEFDICNTSGGAIQDHRIRDGKPIGPFVNEAAFNQLLRNPNDPSRQNHRVFFTHADLNLRNILVDEVTRADGSTSWHVSGIVDWENAGYYPEYWEYTKALFESFRYNDRSRQMIHDVFEPFGNYSKEVEVEKRSWEEGDYI